MLPRNIRQRKYADHPTWWGYSDRDYCIMRGTAEEVEALTMTEGLQASIDRDLLPAWRKAKDEAYLAGMQQGANLVEMMAKQPHYLEPYLEYLYCLGVGQAIANHGRDIVGAEKLAAKAQDTEGKKR